jgi:hypothetical protein
MASGSGFEEESPSLSCGGRKRDCLIYIGQFLRHHFSEVAACSGHNPNPIILPASDIQSVLSVQVRIDNY